MKYSIEISTQAKKDITAHIKAGDKKLADKIEIFIDELAEHPRTGTGKPEPLRGYKAETWSRRINDRHRLIYEIANNELTVIAISAFGHYGNK